jgi:DNA-binding response OmpR family regulator
MRLLVIEDEPNTVEAITICLQIYKPGFNLDITDKGLTGVQLLKKERFNTVILDLGLPDIDGIEVINQIRAFSRIPILVVSARHSPGVIDKALKSGADAYITKPFDFKLLLEKLDQITLP